jgi:1,4-dihydroxy-2-naphthoate polyprenyltransferase
MQKSKSNRSAREQNVKGYSPLSPSLCFQIAAPHTWAAAIMPVLFSCVYCAVAYLGKISILFTIILLLICIFMQSAVNVFNDYFDFKKGTDTAENSSEDAFDAVLVYNNVNPRSVCAFGVVLLVVAGALGLYLTFVTGWMLLVIGIVGAIIVVLYSGGKTPISYLPIGEFVSGFVMGGLIPLACCYTLSGILDPWVLLASFPIMFGIGMILLTNNTCDIEKDIPAKRTTISVVLGRSKAPRVYKIAILFWIVIIVALVGTFYSSGMPILMLMVLAEFPVLRAIMNNPLNQKSRTAAMSQIVMLNVIMGAFYCLAISSCSFISWI